MLNYTEGDLSNSQNTKGCKTLAVSVNKDTSSMSHAEQIRIL